MGITSKKHRAKSIAEAWAETWGKIWWPIWDRVVKGEIPIRVAQPMAESRVDRCSSEFVAMIGFRASQPDIWKKAWDAAWARESTRYLAQTIESDGKSFFGPKSVVN